MVTDKQRREVAQELRELRHTTYYREEAVENICDAISIADSANTFREPEDIYKLLADLIEPQPIDGNTSDGYHTFNELYHHRAVLSSVIVENFAARAWKSKLHADGTMYEGMFIVGIETPDGQATYHYDMPYWDLFRCKEVDRAPEWDGHTPGQAIERIGKLVDCKTDRPTCRLDLTDVETYGNTKVRIYECSECGRTCEEIYGKYERCPHCGAEVIE